MSKRKAEFDLDPVHGVNPAIPLCFFCNKPKNEILLPGRLPGGIEAPKNMVWDMAPCDECAGYMKQGVILISVDEAKSQDDRRNPWRTGGWCVVTEDFIRRMITPAELAEETCKNRAAFVPDEAWDMLGLPRGNSKP